MVGIKIRNKGRVYYIDPRGLDLKKGDKVVADTAWGLTFGTVCIRLEGGAGHGCNKDLKSILRKITPDDESRILSNQRLEQEALSFCLERIAQKGLNMKLVESQYPLDGSKLIFYFTAEERIDFRDLVKDLAYKFKVRIEMKQIGVRDEARMFEGYGCCGRQFCCSTFIDEFEPVTIRMARCQEMTLNPTKISGVCGRLMCCIAFEYDSRETKETEREVVTLEKDSSPEKSIQEKNNSQPDTGIKKSRRRRRRHRKPEGQNNA